MESFDFSREYGIVLEGGGAKGAYQIGVWKALMEFGVKIRAVAGVSVGALNGALICMGDYEKAVNIWKNISYSSIMNVDDAEMDKLLGRRFRDINIQTVTKQGKKFLVGGGIDITPLRQLLDENVDEQRIRESDIDFIMGTFNVSKMKEEEIPVKEAQDGSLKDYLLASASFPLFKNDKLLGKTYLDGGVANNVPIDMLLKRGYKDIIVVRIFGPGLEKRIKIPEDVNVINIAPKCHLCNVLEFNNKKAMRNISMGYYDAVRMLKPLAGIEYYIDSARSEKEYMDSLLNLTQEQMKELIPSDKTADKLNGSLLRRYAEEIYPQMAAQFKLKKDWRYNELYYSILEYCAKKTRMKKYRIYTEQEFCQMLLSQLSDKYEEAGKPDGIMDLGLALIRNNFA
jgi:NTE family protein